MYYYILNPAAGKGRINQIQDKLRQTLKELGIPGEFAKTTGPGDATRMAAAAVDKGFTTVVAVGGDGTVNEVVNGIKKDNVAVGIIPIGDSNLLARRLGIENWMHATSVLAQRRITSLSLIAAGQNYFLNSLIIGFESDLDKHVESSEEGWRGLLKQFKESWGHARDFQPLKCFLKTNLFEMECEVFSLTVSNQKFYDPSAANKLVVNITDKPSRQQLTGYLLKLIRRQELDVDAATTRFTADRLMVESKPATGLTIDGKVAGRTPIAIRLTDRQIRFITEKPPSEFRQALS